MKRSILIALVFLFAASFSSLAQQPNVAEAVFEKWKREAPAEEVSKLRFALAAVARRTGDEMAELDLWAVGSTPGVEVEIQPLHIEKLLNGEYRQEQAGAPAKNSIGSRDSQNAAGDKTYMKIVFPVGPNANALEIKWLGYAGGKVQYGHGIQVWLRNEPSEALTRVSGGQ